LCRVFGTRGDRPILEYLKALCLDSLKSAGQYIASSWTEGEVKMHFRERAHIVQIIRTTYDAGSKKGKNEIVGRLVKANPVISAELEAALTTEERKDVAAWIKGYATVGQLKKELAARSLPEQLALAEEWFAHQKGNEAHTLAAALIPAWVQLRTVLKRNGLIE
jgi:hypothetical protein